MFFRVNGSISDDTRNCGILYPDNWDDWFQFRTVFSLLIIDADGNRYQAGSVKIARAGLQPGPQIQPGMRAPEMPPTFDMLPEGYFSLGQGEDYYETLNKLSQELRERILVGLRDCAFNLDIFRAFQAEPSMTVSLLRSVSAKTVEGRLHRLSVGDVALTDFQFAYTLPRTAMEIDPPTLRFDVIPESEPPTNVHVLIGRNGVGKTRAIRFLIETLLGRIPDVEGAPSVMLAPSEDGEWSFAGLVLISFSAFDNFDLQPLAADAIPAEQVGLKHRIVVDGVEQGGIKAPKDLAVDFRKSLERCREGLRADRWRKAVSALESDELFAEANVRSLLESFEDEWSERVEQLFTRLSSGHAIVLLTMTRLVELVDEKTLVILDEPEGHLHPPLLAAFIRALSDLLVKRNGVAIVATHSPVVLQEAPRSCAWKLRRGGAVSVAERPVVETFGENIGILTREVFGLEVTRAGFHQLLDTAVNELGLNYDGVLDRFGGQLGAEAKAIVQAMIARRDVVG